MEEASRADSIRFAAARQAAEDALRIARTSRGATETRIVLREAPADTAAFRRGFQAGRDSTTLYEIRPLLALRVAQDSAYAAQGRLLTAEREARLTAQEGLEAALRERDLLRGARPSWLSRNGPKILLPVAVAGGWYLRGVLAGR